MSQTMYTVNNSSSFPNGPTTTTTEAPTSGYTTWVPALPDLTIGQWQGNESIYVPSVTGPMIPPGASVTYTTRPDISLLRTYLHNYLASMLPGAPPAFSIGFIGYNYDSVTDDTWLARVDFSTGYNIYTGHGLSVDGIEPYTYGIGSPLNVQIIPPVVPIADPEVMSIGDEAADNFFFDERG